MNEMEEKVKGHLETESKRKAICVKGQILVPKEKTIGKTSKGFIGTSLCFTAIVS